MKNITCLLTVIGFWLMCVFLILSIYNIPFGVFSIAMYSSVLLIRPVFIAIDFFKKPTFKSVHKNGFSTIHMSVYANITTMNKSKLHRLKNGLYNCVINAFKNGEVKVIMRSHILSEFRIFQIKRMLAEEFPGENFNVDITKVQTTAFESFAIKANFIVSEWRFVDVKTFGLEAKFTKQ